MTITIAPFTVSSLNSAMNENSKDVHSPIIYWGIYLDDKYISHTSSKEQAEKTKVWIEKWLRDRH
ncbi:MAG TPA: hypothetical protein VLB01_01550 [Thermodesulfobacteriota bacterium]|nr:hypothetical protein [Thermodesulfobacteriota bacterium]